VCSWWYLYAFAIECRLIFDLVRSQSLDFSYSPSHTRFLCCRISSNVCVVRVISRDLFRALSHMLSLYTFLCLLIDCRHSQVAQTVHTHALSLSLSFFLFVSLSLHIYKFAYTKSHFVNLHADGRTARVAQTHCRKCRRGKRTQILLMFMCIRMHMYLHKYISVHVHICIHA